MYHTTSCDWSYNQVWRGLPCNLLLSVSANWGNYSSKLCVTCGLLMPLCLYCSHCRFQPATFPDPDWNWGGLVTSRFLCLLCFWLQISSNQWLQYVSMSWTKEVNNLKLLRVAQLLITQNCSEYERDEVYSTTWQNVHYNCITSCVSHYIILY